MKQRHDTNEVKIEQVVIQSPTFYNKNRYFSSYSRFYTAVIAIVSAVTSCSSSAVF